MAQESQRDPDAILAELRLSELADKGRLTVFLGMSPGVGKTYTMLNYARQRQREGVNVLVGIVETHGRKETEALLELLGEAETTETLDNEIEAELLALKEARSHVAD